MKETIDLLRVSLEELLVIALGPEDDEKSFVELGVDSVVATEWIEFIRRELKPDLKVAALFDYPSLRQLASYLKEEIGSVFPESIVSKAASIPLGSSIAYPPIAVIGIAGRFPDADNVHELWQNLIAGLCSVKQIPENRNRYWDLAQLGSALPQSSVWGGFLKDVECFDAGFFGIPAPEASVMDPQQRLFLEEAWNAIEDAGYANEALSGIRCGVYAGVMNTDYQDLLTQVHSRSTKVHELTGSAPSILAARIAYHLNLRGPAVAVDTACSSSLTALHFACRALQLGEIDMALSGGVTLYLTRKRYHLMEQAGMLSQSGACRPFDDAADGMVPGEAVGVVVLKRLEDAVRDRDATYGVIVSSGLNQDGKTNGITAPSRQAQRDLLSEVYRRGNIDSATVQYIEAHGTGTNLGDPIELEALTNLFSAIGGSPLTRPTSAVHQSCVIGSVKANLGHTTAAAGVTSLIKILLSLQNETIPPQIHFSVPNRNSTYSQSPFRVSTEPLVWSSVNDTVRRAALSSFGFSGTNGHVIVQESPSTPNLGGRQADRECWIILSAKTLAALKRRVMDMKQWLDTKGDNLSVLDLSFTLAVGRSAFEERLAFLACDINQVRAGLEQFLTSRDRGIRLWRGPSSEQWMYGREYKEVGEAWVQGNSIDWSSLYVGLVPRRLHLPAYPFMRERYWYDTSEKPALPDRLDDLISAVPVDQLLGVKQDLGPGQIIYHSEISCQKQVWLADHRIFDTIVSPGALYLAMASAAAGDGHHMSNVVMVNPLVLPGEQARFQLQLIVDPIADDNPQRRFQFYSRPLSEKSFRWTLHAEGIIEAKLGEPESVSPERVSRLRAKLNEKLAKDYYASIREYLTLGPSFRGLHSLWTEQDEALGEIRLPAGIAHNSAQIHPVTLDACMQVLNSANAGASRAFYVPFECERVVLHADVPEHFYCYARLRREGQAGEAVTGDLWLLDPDEREVFGRIGGLLLKSITKENLVRAAAKSGTEQWLYEIDWHERPRVLERETENEKGLWLVAADDQGVAERVVERLRSRSQECVLVKPSQGGQTGSGTVYQLNGEDANQWEQLLTELTKAYPPLRGIVHFWSLDSTPSQKMTAETLYEGTQRNCGSVLALVQALLRRDLMPRHGLWLVTQGAQCTTPGVPSSPETPSTVDRLSAEGVPSLCQSPLWGMAKVLSLEHAELGCRRVDLEFDVDSMCQLRQLDGFVAELLQPDTEDQIAWRGERRFVARLRQSDQMRWPKGTTEKQHRLDETGVYLITGGLGGLGLALARWLVDKGVKRLVLNGRRAPSAEVKKEIERLQHEGATVEVIFGDIANAGEVKRLLEQIERDGSKLIGIFHLAAVLEDGALLNQTWSKFDRVLAPKMLGAWHLHQLTLDRAPEVFVLFSSIASVLGHSGQSNYAAANMFLDMLAYHRKSLGLPAKSINWGAWSEVGAAARLKNKFSPVDIGLNWMSPENALRALEQAFYDPHCQTVIASIDWKQFRRDQRAGRSFLEAVVVSNEERAYGGATQQRPSEFRRRLQEVPSKVRSDSLIEFLQQEIMLALRLSVPPNPTIGFSQLGMDSLMMVELRNRLQRELTGLVDLSATILFKYPNPAALAAHLADLFETRPDRNAAECNLERIPQESAPVGTVQRTKSPDVFQGIDSLSVHEAEQLLLKELNELKEQLR
jgi:acyl transferase domain-containing protein/acyl carrier protein